MIQYILKPFLFYTPFRSLINWKTFANVQTCELQHYVLISNRWMCNCVIKIHLISNMNFKLTINLSINGIFIGCLNNNTKKMNKKNYWNFNWTFMKSEEIMMWMNGIVFHSIFQLHDRKWVQIQTKMQTMDFDIFMIKAMKYIMCALFLFVMSTFDCALTHCGLLNDRKSVTL